MPAQAHGQTVKANMAENQRIRKGDILRQLANPQDLSHERNSALLKSLSFDIGQKGVRVS